jgi:hypothetical protein
MGQSAPPVVPPFLLKDGSFQFPGVDDAIATARTNWKLSLLPALSWQGMTVPEAIIARIAKQSGAQISKVTT